MCTICRKYRKSYWLFHLTTDDILADYFVLTKDVEKGTSFEATYTVPLIFSLLVIVALFYYRIMVGVPKGSLVRCHTMSTKY